MFTAALQPHGGRRRTPADAAGGGRRKYKLPGRGEATYLAVGAVLVRIARGRALAHTGCLSRKLGGPSLALRLRSMHGILGHAQKQADGRRHGALADTLPGEQRTQRLDDRALSVLVLPSFPRIIVVVQQGDQVAFSVFVLIVAQRVCSGLGDVFVVVREPGADALSGCRSCLPEVGHRP
eukprot:5136309-Prymnesium_polylepis.2